MCLATACCGPVYWPCSHRLHRSSITKLLSLFVHCLDWCWVRFAQHWHWSLWIAAFFIVSVASICRCIMASHSSNDSRMDSTSRSIKIHGKHDGVVAGRCHNNANLRFSNWIRKLAKRVLCNRLAYIRWNNTSLNSSEIAFAHKMIIIRPSHNAWSIHIHIQHTTATGDTLFKTWMVLFASSVQYRRVHTHRSSRTRIVLVRVLCKLHVN